MIKNIILDIGNVLLDFRPKEYFMKTLQDEEVCDTLLSFMLGGDTWKKYDLGYYTLDEVKQELKGNMPAYADTIETMLSSWTDLLVPIAYTMQQMKKWKQEGYGIYLLSNLNKEADLFIEEKYGLCEQADGAILSYKEHLIKPDRAIYECLCERYHLLPEECLFLDDTLVNVEAAREYGMKAIHFTSVEEVKKQLVEYLKESYYAEKTR